MDMLPVDLDSAEQLRLGTETATVVATSAMTDGAMFAVLVRMPPGGGVPVMHRHAPSELYAIREGEFTFYLQQGGEVRRITAGPGDLVPLAGNTPHTIRNETDADAVALLVHTPGDRMEAFTRAGAELAERGEPDLTEVLELAQRHGVELLGPVPAP